jgi:hypothetical protein
MVLLLASGLVACNSAREQTTPSPIPLGVECPPTGEVQLALSSAFPSNDTLTLTASQGTGDNADTLNCTYRAGNGDDIAIQIVAGPRAPVLFSDALEISPANQAVTVAPFQVGTRGWAARAPNPVNGEPEIVAAGALVDDVYANVFYRYLAYPLAASSRRQAPTADETIALLTLTIG